MLAIFESYLWEFVLISAGKDKRHYGVSSSHRSNAWQYRRMQFLFPCCHAVESLYHAYRGGRGSQCWQSSLMDHSYFLVVMQLKVCITRAKARLSVQSVLTVFFHGSFLMSYTMADHESESEAECAEIARVCRLQTRPTLRSLRVPVMQNCSLKTRHCEWCSGCLAVSNTRHSRKTMTKVEHVTDSRMCKMQGISWTAELLMLIQAETNAL